jgi:hypothetical protein
VKNHTFHQFIVTVGVQNDDPDTEIDRAAYAKAALNVVGLADAHRLDGFANSVAEAWVVNVVPL